MWKLLNLAPVYDADGAASGAEPADGAPAEAGDDFNLMDDDAEDESGSDNAEDEAPESGQKPDTKPEVFTIRTVEGDKEVTRDELVRLAQKGGDYDRIRESRDRYMKPLETLAQQAGMSLDQFVPELMKLSQYNAARQTVDQLKPQILNGFISAGYDQATAEALFAQQEPVLLENEMLKGAQTFRQQQESAAQKQTQEMQAQIQHDVSEFSRRFPDVKEIPDEVVNDIRNGENPVVAYQSYLLRENTKKLAAAEQTAKNQQISPGSPKGAGANRKDAFLSEFEK